MRMRSVAPNRPLSAPTPYGYASHFRAGEVCQVQSALVGTMIATVLSPLETLWFVHSPIAILCIFGVVYAMEQELWTGCTGNGHRS